jgi:hypothetical protein
MSNPESQELQMRIDELISATRKGTFQWKAVNPTTYLWEKIDQASGGARLTLQRVEQNIAQVGVPGRPPTIARQSFIILQVIEVKPGGPQVQRLGISGLGDPELNGKLQELFQLASSGYSQQGLEFLKNLVQQG